MFFSWVYSNNWLSGVLNLEFKFELVEGEGSKTTTLSCTTGWNNFWRSIPNFSAFMFSQNDSSNFNFPWMFHKYLVKIQIPHQIENAPSKKIQTHYAYHMRKEHCTPAFGDYSVRRFTQRWRTTKTNVRAHSCVSRRVAKKVITVVKCLQN